MTHGQTPTRRCAPTRAVRLALEELQELATVDEITARANTWSSNTLTPDYVRERILARGVNDGWIEQDEDRFRLPVFSARMEARGERAIERAAAHAQRRGADLARWST